MNNFKQFLENITTLYHGTTKQAAEEIVKTKLLKSKGEPNVYLTTSPSGTGYGDGTVVKVHVNTNDLELDDEFPDGRLDYKLPGKIYKVIKAEIVK
jgi:hypothetical protein